jgi:hypothetical protein
VDELPRFAHIDAEGRLISYVFKQAGIPEEHLPVVALPSDFWQRGFYRWNGVEFEDDLEAARALIWGRVKAARDARTVAGCETPLGPIDTDSASQAKVNGAVTLAILARLANRPFSIDWTMADNVVRTHDAGAMIAAGSAVGLHIAACHEVGRALRDRVEAATSVVELLAIDVEAAPWPGRLQAVEE